MNPSDFSRKLKALQIRHEALVSAPNRINPEWQNNIFDRYINPVLTPDHVPLDWRFDLDPRDNPALLERQGINATFNAGALEVDGKVLLCVRTEGYDRKSFFAMAESASGIDQFRFWDEPVDLPETSVPDTNVYDMRLVRHEDGWIYGTFCTERKDPSAPASDTSSAIAIRAALKIGQLEGSFGLIA